MQQLAFKWTRADKNRPMDLDALAAFVQRAKEAEFRGVAVVKVVTDWRGQPKEILLLEPPDSTQR